MIFIIVNGDPVCADADFPALLSEFKDFCVRSAHKVFFLSVTDHFLEEYIRQGFGYVKCGEEARFSLADYEISGKKGAKMRMNINHAKKAGVTIAEYKPLLQRDPDIESAFDRVTNERESCFCSQCLRLVSKQDSSNRVPCFNIV